MCGLGTSPARLEAQTEFIAPHFPHNGAVLEIGCASGALAKVVREKLPVGRYEGIEISPIGEAAKPHLDVLHKEPLTSMLGHRSVGLLSSFDLVICSHVLEHLTDPRAELGAIMKVLKPDGLAFIEVPNRSGHRMLPIDDNISHLHFFSMASMSVSLSEAGFEVISARTGVRFDARCSDSIEVIGKRFVVPTWPATFLSEKIVFDDDEKIIVWGAGSLANEILANFFDHDRIEFFIDSDPIKIGTNCLGKPVYGPEQLGNTPKMVLVNSIDQAGLIENDILALYPTTRHRLIRMADLLDGLG
jgi:SAM-dependent methyltransferase